MALSDAGTAGVGAFGGAVAGTIKFFPHRPQRTLLPRVFSGTWSRQRQRRLGQIKVMALPLVSSALEDRFDAIIPAIGRYLRRHEVKDSPKWETGVGYVDPNSGFTKSRIGVKSI